MKEAALATLFFLKAMKGTDSATAMADSSNLQNGTSTGTDKTFRSQAELLDSIADVSQEVSWKF